MGYILSKTAFFCKWYWDLLAFLVLAGVIAYVIIKQKKNKETIKELEQQLSAMQADDVVSLEK